MEEDSSISRYRGRLDNTLSSPDLTNPETLRALVKDQIVLSSIVEDEDGIDKIVDTRTKEVSNILNMLRSTSVSDDHGSKTSKVSRGTWKVKQDTEEYRVMYKEGPEGTPFHTLLVEGYVDGPVDVCLCISWEACLYQKWWPQIMVPTFRISSSECLQKVRIGEQICLVRMKLSWPLSAREALIHFYEFEYIKDDLVIVLLSSISDLDSVDRSTHGFTRDGIPDPQDVVRIDVVGGFALQKVSPNRSYFRTIANMDIKLDFVPPAFINFVSRQVVGSGFKLYKKEVASVSKGDAEFSNALKDPLYARIREALYSDSNPTVASQPETLKKDASVLLEEQSGETTTTTTTAKPFFHYVGLEPSGGTTTTITTTITNSLSHYVALEQSNGAVEVNGSNEIVHNDDPVVNSQAEERVVVDKKTNLEIEEIEENDGEEGLFLAADDSFCSSPIKETNFKLRTNSRYSPNGFIRPEVEQALNLLDEVISVFKAYETKEETKFLPGSVHEESPHLEKIAFTESEASELNKNCESDGAFAESTKRVDPEPEVIASTEFRNSSASHCSRHMGYTSYSRDSNHSKIAPASPDKEVTGTIETRHDKDLLSSENQAMESSFSQKIEKEENVVIVVDSNGFEEKTRKRNRRNRLCCFVPTGWQ